MDDTLFLQLHKLPPTNSEKTLEHIFETLWKTRKTGLGYVDRTYFQTLLNLVSIEELDPVLACLRSLIRKCVHESFTSDDILKLFPPDLPLDLQSILLVLLQKYQVQWKQDAASEQPLWQRPRVSYQVKVSSIPPAFTPFSSSEIPSSMWPRQDDPTIRFNCNDISTAAPIVTNNNVSRVASMTVQRDDVAIDNLGILPRLKSMTWTMENQNSTPTNRVAIISLKLQDYTKSPLGETEVKFQLTKDTLEAMMRSMAYISEQLSNIVGSSSGPLQKKQRQ